MGLRSCQHIFVCPLHGREKYGRRQVFVVLPAQFLHISQAALKYFSENTVGRNMCVRHGRPRILVHHSLSARCCRGGNMASIRQHLSNLNPPASPRRPRLLQRVLHISIRAGLQCSSDSPQSKCHLHPTDVDVNIFAAYKTTPPRTDWMIDVRTVHGTSQNRTSERYRRPSC